MMMMMMMQIVFLKSLLVYLNFMAEISFIF